MQQEGGFQIGFIGHWYKGFGDILRILPASDPWILAAGSWNDSGIWIDSETWNDA